jgi:hypothetical protein
MSMADTSPAQALDAVQHILEMCDIYKDLRADIVLVTGEKALPLLRKPLEVNLVGPPPVWIGLGTVGLWAALDAFGERAELSRSRCPICNRHCIWKRFSGHTRNSEGQSLKEFEDLRHLYAHHYAGNADDQYFRRPRHILRYSVPRQLTCGAQFDGQRAWIDLMHLRWYACAVQSVLRRFSKTS